MIVHLLILNHNGRELLAECLPSVLEAGACSQFRCKTTVIDNDSSDDSVAWLQHRYPQVQIEHQPNRGLCSFNRLMRRLDGPVALLLNNDVKLHRHCVDPLVEPLLHVPECFMTAPLCWRFDGQTYDGSKTAVQWHWGLVRATSLYRGHQAGIYQRGWTASAGAALAVNCRRFVELGGFDPLYLPGRLEDLDFAFRGYLAGGHALYVPEAVVYHQGMASFRAAFGPVGCDRLAMRNTLLFQWKNLRHPLHLARQLAGLPCRLLVDLCRAPWLPRHRRWMLWRAFGEAIWRWRQLGPVGPPVAEHLRRERAFFRRFHPRRLADATRPPAATAPAPSADPLPEAGHARFYPPAGHGPADLHTAANEAPTATSPEAP